MHDLYARIFVMKFYGMELCDILVHIPLTILGGRKYVFWHARMAAGVVVSI